MLELFVSENGKDLAALTKALDRRDRKNATAILHKNLPLWETVHLDFPLFRLKELVTSDAETWTDIQYTEIQEIISAVKRLIEYAKQMEEANQ